jgi:anaerobic selenocysteine-containing dehydrogenase
VAASDTDGWKTTACILCSINCGIKVQLSEDGRSIARTRGDEDHPGSRGYLCNKASRLNYYLNRADRLTSPMRRRSDGSYEPIDWETAIAEIAGRLAAIRDTVGGDKIFYYGGGGQGNHLPGAYARTSIQPLGVKYRSNALAQEKTGEFWVADRMFGRWPHGDFEHAQVAVFLGKNPWHSHGIPRARVTVREIAKDPDRTLIVIDPKRSETAELADIHLAVKPGRDAWLLSGMIATLVQEDLLDHDWLAQHASGLEPVIEVFEKLDVAECAVSSRLDEAVIRSTARLIAGADSVAILEDLGVQMNRHSTLVSYLQRLVWTLTGNFGRPGTHYTALGLANFGSGRETGVSPVAGARIIADLVPCNLICEEILTDHPNRYRGMIIESGNPVHSLADSSRWREAMRALDLSVVIDVAMTETAQQADYVLPATSQYEKAEATFFSMEFPENYFHVRKPLFEASDGPLDEAEIHMRLAQALGAVPADIEAELRSVLAEHGREGFRDAVFARIAEQPELMQIAPGLLYRTLGEHLPDGMQNAAALWAVCHQFAAEHRGAVEAAGLTGEGTVLGDALFDRLISAESGAIICREQWSDVWSRVPGSRVRLDLPELLTDVASLGDASPDLATDEYPFVLSAGERRAYTANTILRDPEWRKKDYEGALHINPDDAARLNLGEGSIARITTRGGALDVLVEMNDRMLPGHVSIPNGMGLEYPDESGTRRSVGPSPNELTWSEWRDKYVGTPWHKSVPARIEPV